MKFRNKIVVVTGAGSGIGKACAHAFAQEGATVVVVDIQRAAADLTAEEISKKGQQSLAVMADVSDPVSVESLEKLVVGKFRGIHVLVNNAAIQVNKNLENTTFEEWNRQMAVNVGGVFLCSKYFLPSLKKAKGAIVNMSSVNGFFAEPSCAGYCATKAAIVGLTKAMAVDYGPDGVRVNAIAPGYIDAGLAEGYFLAQPDPAAARREAGKLHSLWRIGRAEEIAQAAVFLASDNASFVTGTSLVVDGGFGSGLPRKE